MFIFSQLSPMGEYAQSGTTGMGATGANPDSSLFASFFSTCLDQTNMQENAWGASDSVSGSAYEYEDTNDSEREKFSTVSGENLHASGSVTDRRSETDTNTASRETASAVTAEETHRESEPASTAEHQEDLYCDDRNGSAVHGAEQGNAQQKNTDTSASEELSGKEESGTTDAVKEDPLETAAAAEDEPLEAADAARAQVVLDWLAGLLGSDSGGATGDSSAEDRLVELGFSETEAKEILDLFNKQGMSASGKEAASSGASLGLQIEDGPDIVAKGLTKDDLALLESVALRIGERAAQGGTEARNPVQMTLEQSSGSLEDVSLEDIRAMLHRTSDILQNSGMRNNGVVSETASVVSDLPKGMQDLLTESDPGLGAGQAVPAASAGNEDKGRATSGTVKDVLNGKVELAGDMQSQGHSPSGGNESGSQGEHAGSQEDFDRTERTMEAVLKSGIDGKKTEVRGESLTSTEKVADLAGSRDIQNLIKNGDRSVKEPSALSRKVLDQVETGAFKNLSQGKKQLTLQLNPGDLGKVQVVLQVKGKDVEAVLRTSNEDTTRILGEQMTQLKDTLEKQGLRVVKLDVQNQAANDARSGQWGGASEHNQSREQQESSLREQHWRSLRGGSEKLAPEMHIPSQQVKTSLRGVDLFA